MEEQRRSAALVEEVHRLQGLEPKGSEDLEVSHALAQQLSQQVDELRLEIRTLKVIAAFNFLLPSFGPRSRTEVPPSKWNLADPRTSLSQ